MNGAGFSIELSEEWKQAVAESEMTEEMLQNIIFKLEPLWLEGHGMDKELYSRTTRVQWDEEWLIRSITVSGNGCGHSYR